MWTLLTNYPFHAIAVWMWFLVLLSVAIGFGFRREIAAAGASDEFIRLGKYWFWGGVVWMAIAVATSVPSWLMAWTLGAVWSPMYLLLNALGWPGKAVRDREGAPS
jgi:hypothetical protein